jgi:lipopolysaccharide transport system ATP-binding protein
MSDIAIRAENLSKLYYIGARQERHSTLRDALANRFASWGKRGTAVNGSGPDPQSPPQESERPSDPTLWALRDVSFEIGQGEVVGVIGRNGAGKSTLLKILSRITEPTSGKVELHGRVGSLLEVGTGFHPELTGRENIYLNGAILGMKRVEIERKFDEIVDFAEIEQFLDTPVKRYSSGMYVRLAFAVAAHLEPEILLVDEVLAVGDAAFQEKCLGKMGDVAHQGRTVLFVSHNMAAIEHLCNRGIVFQHGELRFVARAHDAVAHYEETLFRSLAASNDGFPFNVIYQKPADTPLADFEVTKIEALDELCQPKPQVATWDSVCFRIHFFARKALNAGSVILTISTRHGLTLLLLSTQPDSTMPLPIRAGSQFVDCVVEKLPLSGGEYLIGAGIAIPNKEWLWRDETLGRLTIAARDVYQSGLAPTATRSLLALPHKWKSS